MTARRNLDQHDTCHRADIAVLADHGGYKKLRLAEQYTENVLSWLWRPVLGIEHDDEPLVDQLSFTPTMTLLIHLFGRAVHRHGTQRSKMPTIRHWRGVYDPHAEALRFPRAISKRDIARVIGKSTSAVDDAVGRFRGKIERHEDLYAKRVAHPLWVETGIMLDLMVEPNLSFSFMLEDYSHAAKVVEEARLNDAVTNHRQREWCREAVRQIAPVGRPSAETPNQGTVLPATSSAA